MATKVSAKQKKPAAKKVEAKAKKSVAVKTVAKKTVAKKAVAAKKPVKAVAAKSVKSAAKPAAKNVVKKVVVKTAPAKKGAVKKPSAKPVAKKALAPKPAKKAGGLPEQMRDTALKILDDRKAEDVAVINLAGRSAMADYLIVASGQSSRQVAAMADYLRDAFSKMAASRVRVEGVAEANWAIVDGGDVVVHLFRPEVRAYYAIDELWTKRTPAQE